MNMNNINGKYYNLHHLVFLYFYLLVCILSWYIKLNCFILYKTPSHIYLHITLVLYLQYIFTIYNKSVHILILISSEYTDLYMTKYDISTPTNLCIATQLYT